MAIAVEADPKTGAVNHWAKTTVQDGVCGSDAGNAPAQCPPQSKGPVARAPQGGETSYQIDRAGLLERTNPCGEGCFARRKHEIIACARDRYEIFSANRKESLRLEPENVGLVPCGERGQLDLLDEQ